MRLTRILIFPLFLSASWISGPNSGCIPQCPENSLETGVRGYVPTRPPRLVYFLRSARPQLKLPQPIRMPQKEVWPFVLRPPVLQGLRYVHWNLPFNVTTNPHVHWIQLDSFWQSSGPDGSAFVPAVSTCCVEHERHAEIPRAGRKGLKIRLFEISPCIAPRLSEDSNTRASGPEFSKKAPSATCR
jgi:hypothetical protein